MLCLLCVQYESMLPLACKLNHPVTVQSFDKHRPSVSCKGCSARRAGITNHGVTQIPCLCERRHSSKSKPMQALVVILPKSRHSHNTLSHGI